MPYYITGGGQPLWNPPASTPVLKNTTPVYAPPSPTASHATMNAGGFGGSPTSTAAGVAVAKPKPVTPVGSYIGAGSSADVGAGDKVYQQQVNGGFYNNVYNSAGQQVGHYYHAAPQPTPVYHPGAVAPSVGGTGTNSLGVQIPKPSANPTLAPKLPISTGAGTSPTQYVVPTPSPAPQITPPATPAPTNVNLPATSGTGNKTPSTKTTTGGTSTKLPTSVLPPSTPTPPAQSVPSTPSQTPASQASSGGLPPALQALMDSWTKAMGFNPATDPILAQEMQSENAALNDQYFQKWLNERDKIGQNGLGNSGFLNDAQTRLMLGQQDASTQEYGKLLAARQTQAIDQANAYMNMLKTEQPYYQMTTDQQAVNAINAQKLADAQLNAAGYANINGNPVQSLAYLNDQNTWANNAAKTYGYGSNPITGQTSPTLAALTAAGYSIGPTGNVVQSEKAINDQATQNLNSNKLTAQIANWTAQNQLKANQLQYDYANLQQKQPLIDAQIANYQSLATSRSQSAELGTLKDKLDSLSSQLDNIRTNNPNDPALDPTKVGTPAYQYNQILQSIGSLGTSIAQSAASAGSSGN